MKYLCLGYVNAAEFDRQPEGVKDAIFERFFFQRAMFGASEEVTFEVYVQSSRLTKSIRPKSGKPTVTKGPFLESKEQLFCIFIIEADTIREAIKIVKRHPAAICGEQFGFGIEIRPLH